jgi:hypothetical protein
VVRRGDAEITSELALAATPQLTPVEVANAQPGLRMEKYHGQWEQLPDFTQLAPVETSIRRSAPRMRETPDAEGPEYVGHVYSGFVQIPAEGLYTFTIASDDGSRLKIGEQTIADNDGLHSAKAVSGTVRLQAGFYPLNIAYFEATGGQFLRVTVSGPGIRERELPAEWLFHSP